MRECVRLVELIRAKRSAESLETCELVRLAEWLTDPSYASGVAVYVARELAVRFDRSQGPKDSQASEFRAAVSEMRKAQKAYFAARKKSSEEKESLLLHSKDCERTVDNLLSAERSPALF